MSVLGKRAIVTGATSETGAEMARMLLEGGAAYVGLLDWHSIRLEELGRFSGGGFR